MSLSEAELESFLNGAQSHLESMGLMLDDSGVRLRICDHRDVIAAAHISRIAQTCESMLALCRLRRAHDASALSRVLLEHTISLTYLFSQPDPVNACHAFVFDSLTHIGQAHQQAAKHHPERVTLDAARSQQAIWLGEQVDYQGKFKRQLADLRKLCPDAHFDWYDDLVYGDLSIRTHPHASGMDAFAPIFGSIFTMQRPALLEETASAAVLGLAFTMSSFAWMSHIWGLRLAESIHSSGRLLIEAHPNISPGILGHSILPELPDFLPRAKPKKVKVRTRSEKVSVPTKSLTWSPQAASQTAC